MDDKIKRIHKEGGGEKEEERPKGDGDGGNENTGDGEEREGSASLEDASKKYEIDGAIASRQGTTTNNAKSAKYDDDNEERIVGIPQFWV